MIEEDFGIDTDEKTPRLTLNSSAEEIYIIRATLIGIS